jgi:hypothetical protein
MSLVFFLMSKEIILLLDKLLQKKKKKKIKADDIKRYKLFVVKVT